MPRKSILIVDDSPLIVYRLKNLLAGWDQISTIDFAGDYSGACLAIEKNPPDIALLDIHLPGRSGIEILRYIKKDFPATTVIMLTNQSDEYYRKRCMDLGADYFVDKSRDYEHLPVVIASIP